MSMRRLIERLEEAKGKSNYTVDAGNVGTVYDGNSLSQAKKVYEKYWQMSASGVGRVGGEVIVLFHGEEIIDSYDPDDDDDRPDENELGLDDRQMRER